MAYAARIAGLILCVVLTGCASSTPVETDDPSYNQAAVEYCQRKPESRLCRK